MAQVKELNSRQLQAIQTRTRLFDCAHALLREKDFKDIKIREIVEAAGVSTGTFYLYFHSKLDVYYQTYDIADRYFEEIVAPNLNQDTTKGRIMVFFDFYATYNAEEAGLRLTKLLYNSENKYFSRKSDHGMLPMLISLISDGMAKGEVAGTVPAKELAEMLMIAARGLVYHWCSSDGEFDLNARMKQYMEFIITES